MKTLTLLAFLCLAQVSFLFAQEPDKFSGTWAFAKTDESGNRYELEIQIAAPEQQTLYPAQLTLRYAQFTGVYHLLLVRKNNYQLAIGRQKYAVKEEPFGLGAYTIPFNGTLDLQNNQLTVNRIPAKRYGFAVPALSMYQDTNKTAVLRISEFLRDAPVSLSKLNAAPWRNAAVSQMLYTHNAPDYFGLSDSFYVHQAKGSIGFTEIKQSDDDTISVMLNRKMIVDRIDLSKIKPVQEITLDTGMNILCFFADNYGKVPPNTGKLNLAFGDKKYSLDFTAKQNVSATFIVAKIFLLPDNKQNTPAEINARQTISKRVETRQTKWIDSIKATSQEVTLAFWDDAVEDGDSISLQINDEIYMPGLAVKKQPQFIKVNLYPGENKIIFIADNLGAIPPNTSMLEIIDGKNASPI
ncbi:MAG: hypothetical protein QM687_12540 [Ferruginibacter sp.]